MKIMKKISIMIIASALTVGSIGGCAAKEASSVSTSETPKEEAKEEQQTLVICSWGGALQDAQREAIFKPFEEKYNVKIIDESPTDYGKLKAMVESGNTQWDVVDVDADFVYRAAEQGLLEKLDFNVIDKTDLEPAGTTEYSVGAELFSLALAYNTEAYATGENPKSWKEFWDTEKFPGVRTMWKYVPSLLETALLADGVPLDEVYPLDVDRAFKSLDKIKDQVTVWWTTGAQAPQLLTDNEAQLAAAWNGRISVAKKEGASVDVDFNESILMLDDWVVPKGSKNKELAMKFIAFATAPEQQAAQAKLIPYGVINEKAYDLLDEATIKELPTSPEKSKNQLMLNAEFWGENYDSINERFQKWLLE